MKPEQIDKVLNIVKYSLEEGRVDQLAWCAKFFKQQHELAVGLQELFNDIKN